MVSSATELTPLLVKTVSYWGKKKKMNTADYQLGML